MEQSKRLNNGLEETIRLSRLSMKKLIKIADDDPTQRDAVERALRIKHLASRINNEWW